MGGVVAIVLGIVAFVVIRRRMTAAGNAAPDKAAAGKAAAGKAAADKAAADKAAADKAAAGKAAADKAAADKAAADKAAADKARVEGAINVMGPSQTSVTSPVVPRTDPFEINPSQTTVTSPVVPPFGIVPTNVTRGDVEVDMPQDAKVDKPGDFPAYMKAWFESPPSDEDSDVEVDMPEDTPPKNVL